MLNDCAWRQVNRLWAEELPDWQKLSVLQELVGRGFKARCVGVRWKKMRRVLTKLRGGTAELQVEMGRWRGLRREDKKCAECGSEELEDVKHFLMRCEAWDGERKELMEKMKSLVAGFDEEEKERRLALILDLACQKVSIERYVDSEKVWTARFE